MIASPPLLDTVTLVPNELELYVDAAAAIAFATNVGSKTRMKHLDIRLEWIQELRDSNLVEIIKVSTDEQRADPFTKILERVAFKKALPFIQDDLDQPPNLN